MGHLLILHVLTGGNWGPGRLYFDTTWWFTPVALASKFGGVGIGASLRSFECIGCFGTESL
jgi:hypothetical protein